MNINLKNIAYDLYIYYRSIYNINSNTLPGCFFYMVRLCSGNIRTQDFMLQNVLAWYMSMAIKLCNIEFQMKKMYNITKLHHSIIELIKDVCSF